MTKLLLTTHDSAYRLRDDAVKVAKCEMWAGFFLALTWGAALFFFASFMQSEPESAPFFELFAALILIVTGMGIYFFVHYEAFDRRTCPSEIVVTQLELEQMEREGVPKVLIENIEETTILWTEAEHQDYLFAKRYLEKLRQKR